MSFFSWLNNRTKTQTPQGRVHRPAAPPQFRPRLEALEGRDVPSTLTVTSPHDNGPHSLRAAIVAASANDVKIGRAHV